MSVEIVAEVEKQTIYICVSVYCLT